MTPISIAFVTCRELPDLTADDLCAARLLREQGIRVDAAVWDDPSVRWERYAGIVLRSTWDYHLRPAEFAAWIRRVEQAGARLWNPPEVVLWNMDKVYLRDLARKGIALPPTLWLAQGTAADLAEILTGQGWDRAVVKPTISASAHQTWVTTPAQARADQANLEALLAHSGAIIQQFVPEIVAQGEWSLVFFDKHYSHAALKRFAAPPDYRDPAHFDFSLGMASPAPALIEQAQAVVDSISAPLLYTRVDGVARDGKLILIELELIEPALFLSITPRAAENFARAIRQAVDIIS